MATEIADRNNPSVQMVVNADGSINVIGTVTTNPNPTESTQYELQGWPSNGSIIYLTKSKNDGKWLTVEVDATNETMRYANESNNPTMTSYDLAYAARESLTYEKIEDLTGL